MAISSKYNFDYKFHEQFNHLISHSEEIVMVFLFAFKKHTLFKFIVII